VSGDEAAPNRAAEKAALMAPASEKQGAGAIFCWAVKEHVDKVLPTMLCNEQRSGDKLRAVRRTFG
jgi:hypothetical protein